MSTQSWPSLYNWIIELFPIQNRAPVQPGGIYLYDHNEIFRFTLYWTLVFYTPPYILCASYAFLNLTFPPQRARNRLRTRPRPSFASHFPSSYFGPPPTVTGNEIPLVEAAPKQVLGNTHAQLALAHRYRALLKPNERRSRLAFALLVFLGFTTFSVAGAVIGSAIIGYILAGLFQAGKYNMSTWIPFLAGLLQTLVGLLELWPSVIDII
ncbi:hypothetical protein DAEQUDRAFT_170626 [Daedalea quercina L-15889]|uniref:Integral membrane protein n=1 Tax=Daedalea quercina L-15889 TaxID=1314783 RepID=A0A165RK76_9APHY|nr:hypothetical protein DAEQUDRAFT_170626 [Daedalea quercina L-15889]